MNDLQISRIIGANNTGVSGVLQSQHAAWVLVVMQKNHATADSELNVLQQLLQQQQARVWAALAGDGVVTRPTPATSSDATHAVIHSGAQSLRVVIAGEMVEIRNSDDATTINLDVGAKPATGTRTDLIYLRVSNEEVQPTSSPESASTSVYVRGNTLAGTLTNDLGAVETTRRVQQRHTLLTAVGATTLPTIYGATTRAGGAEDRTVATGSIDGVWRAIPIATLTRSASDSVVATSAIVPAYRLVLIRANSDRVDLFNATTSPTASQLLALGANARFPSIVFTALPSGTTAVSVQGFSAAGSSSTTPLTLVALDGSAKIPNALLATGSGKGLDVDSVDGRSTGSGAGQLLPLNSSTKYSNAVIYGGSGNGFDADTVDTYHVSTTPVANRLLTLDSAGKYPTSILRDGSGNGFDSDYVDLLGVGYSAGSILPLNGSAKFPNTVVYGGHGNGFDADTINGKHASDFALAGHTHPGLFTYSWPTETQFPGDSAATAMTLGPFFVFPNQQCWYWIYTSAIITPRNVSGVVVFRTTLREYDLSGNQIAVVADTRRNLANGMSGTFADGTTTYAPNSNYSPQFVCSLAGSYTPPANRKLGLVYECSIESPTIGTSGGGITVTRANYGAMIIKRNG